MKLLIITLLAIVLSVCALGQSTVGFRGNFATPGTFNSPDIKTPELLWKFRTDGQIFSSPIIKDGILYIGSNDRFMYAIDASTNKLLWKYATKGQIRSTPAVDEKTVYFAAFDSSVYAVDRITGIEKWRFKMRNEGFHKSVNLFGLNTGSAAQVDPWDFYFSSPALDGNRLYVGSGDSSIYCLDKIQGNKIWEYKTGGIVHSSPAVVDGIVYSGSWDSKIYALDAISGKLIWEFLAGMDTAYNCFVGFQASPVIREGVLYCGSRDAAMYALDAKTGKLIWKTFDPGMSWFPSSVTVRGDFIYTGSSDAHKFYCFNKKTGYIEYYRNTWSYTFSSPALSENAAYIGSANGRLYCIEPGSGNLNWTMHTDASKTSLYVEYDGKQNKRFYSDIYDYGTGWENTKQVERLCCSNGAVFSSPFIDNGIIYFAATDGYVYAVREKPGNNFAPEKTLLVAKSKKVSGGYELVYQLNEASTIRIIVVSYKEGKYEQIKELYKDARDAGTFTQSWDETDAEGKAVKEGIYFFEIQQDDAGRFIQCK